MYSLHLTCSPQEAEDISVALWEAGTAGIREEERGEFVELIAGFADSVEREPLAQLFAAYAPEWEREADTDWVAETERAWPAREIGQRIFLAPVWNQEATPEGRVRVIHNPGLASGTGEHPCTQLALESMERCVQPGCAVVDVGTGSGILSAAARALGARSAIGFDIDIPSLESAKENLELNAFPALLVAGTADCVAAETADVVVANISGSVLLALADELLRVVRPGGKMILTGFPASELAVLKQAFGDGAVSEMNEWRCLTLAIT